MKISLTLGEIESIYQATFHMIPCEESSANYFPESREFFIQEVKNWRNIKSKLLLAKKRRKDGKRKRRNT